MRGVPRSLDHNAVDGGFPVKRRRRKREQKVIVDRGGGDLPPINSPNQFVRFVTRGVALEEVGAPLNERVSAWGWGRACPFGARDALAGVAVGSI